MRDGVPIETLTADLREHPAVRAWNQLQPEQVPEEIETLKKKNKSAVYRLRGVGRDGSNVIAKRCLATSARVEITVYQEILPCLPFSALCCYGMVEDGDPEFTWLFVEDAGFELYSAALPEHRALLARWLAIVHTAGQEVQAARLLPERGPAHFLDHLRLARAGILENADNPALGSDDCVLLERIVAQCDFLEDRWPQIEEFCAGIPRTFVHCDLKEKNMRVRRLGQVSELLCFDWENAGWGLTGPDLTKCPDFKTYFFAARARWPELRERELERVFQAGVLFRVLAETHWETSHLQFQWLERARLTLRMCHERLTHAIKPLERLDSILSHST